MNLLRAFSKKPLLFSLIKNRFSTNVNPKILTDEIHLTEDCIKVHSKYPFQ